jgi:hypothetical protein
VGGGEEKKKKKTRCTFLWSFFRPSMHITKKNQQQCSPPQVLVEVNTERTERQQFFRRKSAYILKNIHFFSRSEHKTETSQ